MQRLAVEPTLCTVREGHKTNALVLNTTGGSIKLRQGVFLSEALAYDGQVVSEPLDLPEPHRYICMCISQKRLSRGL